MASPIATTLFITILVALVNADSVLYEWTISLSQRAPLGVNKQVITINDQFPGPPLDAKTNDVISVNIRNNLADPFLMTWNGVQLRRSSWQDGVQETNCPILPGQNWTYTFQLKDQIGSFFYFPSLLLQKAGGGYGAIRIHNRDMIPVPFPQPHCEIDVLIGDWHNADYRDMRALLDDGGRLPPPDGILINGLGPNQAVFKFQPGSTYRLRISNVGLKTSLNFRIQDHLLQLVESEGSYTVQKYYSSLDIHVGQSYSVLVTAKNQTKFKSYYMIASSRFTMSKLFGLGIIQYPGAEGDLPVLLPSGPLSFDYLFSLQQARTIRLYLEVGAARPNPQGSFHYGHINVSRTLVLQNGVIRNENKMLYSINGVSFVHPDTPLKLADHFQYNDLFNGGVIPDRPSANRVPLQGTSVIDVVYREFFHLVFQNPLPCLQTWHLDGYNFFVVGMEYGVWDESKKKAYNMVDAVSRSTVQVFPHSWTAVLVMMDNQGLWNLRSQDAENWYLGQELYFRVKGAGEEDPSSIPVRDEVPIPENVILCGRAKLP